MSNCFQVLLPNSACAATDRIYVTTKVTAQTPPYGFRDMWHVPAVGRSCGYRLIAEHPFKAEPGHWSLAE
jgi:hypothetical protein